MSRRIHLLLSLCIMAIGSLLAVQFYWIRNYYVVTKINFERDVNLSFEDAIKKEFSLRNDTIESLLVNRLMDTSVFRITSDTILIPIDINTRNKRIQFLITEVRSNKQVTGFSYKELNRSLMGDWDTSYKRNVAQHFAHGLRTEDLENHVVFYRTQELGRFEVKQVEKYEFDTVRLRPVLAYYLAQRNIHVPFQFLLRQNDSTLNATRFPDSLSLRFPVITKSFPTYKWTNNTEQYVRAMFSNPAGYLISQISWLFGSTLTLIGLVAGCIYLLLKTLYQEKRLSVMKNDFIDNITHELKTPIATLSAAVEAMSDFGVLRDERKATRYLQHSRNELNRLNGLVNKVLNLSIYEQGQFEIYKEEILLEETIGEVMEALKVATSKTISYQFTSTTPRRSICTDKTHFQQAISNVLDNSIKYAGDAVQIMITCYEKEAFLLIAIQDNGIGIRSTDLPLVFDRFYRAVANSHAVKGHGLGLNYVHSVMKGQGGYVTISSTEGEGTIITLAWLI